MLMAEKVDPHPNPATHYRAAEAQPETFQAPERETQIARKAEMLPILPLNSTSGSGISCQMAVAGTFDGSLPIAGNSVSNDAQHGSHLNVGYSIHNFATSSSPHRIGDGRQQSGIYAITSMERRPYLFRV